MAKKQKIRLQRVEEAVHDTVDKLAQLLQEEPAGAEYIHRIRVHIKRQRAWLRLQRVKVDEFYWKDMDLTLRNHASALGQARDKQIVRDKLKDFSTRAVSADEINAIKRVIRNCDKEEVVTSIDWPALKTALLADLAVFREYYMHIHSLQELRKDLKRHFKRTIRSANRAYTEGRSFEDLHRFRKNVKALNYQLGYLNKGFSNRAKKEKKNFSELGEILGHIHDIDVVQNFINQLPARRLYKPERKVLAQLLERELQDLLRESHKVYDQAFSTSPGDFIGFIK